MLPTTPLAVGALAIRAAVDRELQVEIVSPTGGAERWFAAWRWWDARPRLSVGLEAPAPFGGTWRVSAADERESFAFTSGTSQERRRSVSVAAADWMSSTWKWEAELRGERWPGGASAAGALGGCAIRRSTIVSRSAYVAASGRRPPRPGPGSVLADWRLRAQAQGTVWLGRAGVDAAGVDTPLALWSGAGTGQGRPALVARPPAA